MIEISSSLAEEQTKLWTDNWLTLKYQFSITEYVKELVFCNYFSDLNKILVLGIFCNS